MSLALWNEVESLKGRVRDLESTLVKSVKLEDVTALIRENKDLAERVEKLEAKANKRG